MPPKKKTEGSLTLSQFNQFYKDTIKPDTVSLLNQFYNDTIKPDTASLLNQFYKDTIKPDTVSLLNQFYNDTIKPDTVSLLVKFDNETLGPRLQNIEDGLTEHDRRFDRIDEHLDHLYKGFEDLRQEYVFANEQLRRLEKNSVRKESLAPELADLKTKVANLQQRIQQLEQKLNVH